jgi:hypothetical protein
MTLDPNTRVRELVAEQQNRNYTQTSRLFTILMLVQWSQSRCRVQLSLATLSPYARC